LTSEKATFLPDNNPEFKMALQRDLINKAGMYVEEYMNKFDGSHDFSHIRRVLGTAHQIYSQITKTSVENSSNNARQPLDLEVITLCAVLHDVGDRKYLKEGENQKTLVQDLLLGFGADIELAMKVQTICLAVSYSEEKKDPAYVQDLIAEYPELAVVQDADRLDAIGAVGIGRVFTYGGAKTTRGMEGSIEMTEIKLFELEGMMKTGPGREIARERTERLRIFRGWWDEEVETGSLGSKVLALAES
jgi:uncharacterized protein